MIEGRRRSPRIFGGFMDGDLTVLFLSSFREPGKWVKVMNFIRFMGVSGSLLLVPLMVLPVVFLNSSLNSAAQTAKAVADSDKASAKSSKTISARAAAVAVKNARLAAKDAPSVTTGSPLAAKDAPSATKGAPVAIKDAPPATKGAPAAVKDAPSAGAVSDGHQYVLYKNEPFKYSIEYAADQLIPYKNYKGTEGITLDGVDKQTFMCLGAEVPLHFDDGHLLSIDEVYHNTRGEGGKVLKTEKGKDWFVVSMAGTSNDPRYTYVKVIFGGSKTEPLVMKSFRFTYPSAKQSVYQSMIRRMSDSFRNSK